ncbi:MAG: ferredoxin--NADP reductase [Deltaproteobacteria bacterium]|nr:ferredoxin--NADP reductase [Deltaproteobacteria bacterium]
MSLTRALSPRRLRVSTAQLRRDIEFLWAHRDRTPAPVRAVAAPDEAPRPGLRLRVLAIREETAEARTIFLESADPSRPLPRAEAGQFLTFELPIGGERLRRSYSLSTSPLDPGPVAVTVKRVAEGRASTWLTSALAVGDQLQTVGPPGGRFVFRPQPGAARTVALIGAGSGITPLMSIARTALASEPGSRVVLVYGNRSPEDIIFRAALDELVAASADRFAVHHVLERGAGTLGATRGRLGAALLARQLPVALAGTAPGEVDAFYVCGPPAVMDHARTALLQHGVPEARIHEERFQPLPPAHASDVAATVRVRRGRSETDVRLEPAETLLQAALRAGVPMPSSCTMGGCGACRVRVLEGALAMPDAHCLSAAERRDGYALACVARCAGPATVEVPE